MTKSTFYAKLTDRILIQLHLNVHRNFPLQSSREKYWNLHKHVTLFKMVSLASNGPHRVRTGPYSTGWLKSRTQFTQRCHIYLDLKSGNAVKSRDFWYALELHWRGIPLDARAREQSQRCHIDLILKSGNAAISWIIEKVGGEQSICILIAERLCLWKK